MYECIYGYMEKWVCTCMFNRNLLRISTGEEIHMVLRKPNWLDFKTVARIASARPGPWRWWNVFFIGLNRRDCVRFWYLWDSLRNFQFWKKPFYRVLIFSGQNLIFTEWFTFCILRAVCSSCSGMYRLDLSVYLTHNLNFFWKERKTGCIDKINWKMCFFWILFAALPAIYHILWRYRLSRSAFFPHGIFRAFKRSGNEQLRLVSLARK